MEAPHSCQGQGMEAFNELLLILPILLLSVVVHEYAHARVAVWQGDPTPREAGRLTLNPIPHVDPVGSLLVPAVLWLLPGSFLFGWARPVPIDGDRFHDRRRGEILVSVAGVTANFLLGAACILVVAACLRAEPALGAAAAPLLEGLRRMGRVGIFFNFLLAVFNLLPIPPLDGSHLVYHLLPARAARRYRKVGRYSVLLLVAALLFPGLLEVLLFPVRLLTSGADVLIALLS